MFNTRIGIGGSALLFLVVFLTAAPAAENRFPDELKTALSRISTDIYNDRFESAQNLLDSLRVLDKWLPVCHLFQAILYQSHMMAAESDFLKDQLFAVLDTLDADTDSLLSHGADSAMAFWLLGNSHAFRSLFLGRAGSILGALRHGLSARKAFDRGYDIDPGFHDIALGLGSYRYWKSVKTKAINWTPLFKEEKRNGIELIRLAADSAEISSEAAQAALIWVYLNEGLYAEAIRLARKMRYRYPDGLSFLWALGEAYRKLNDCRGAVEIYETILARLHNHPGNYYNIIEAAHYLSECYRRMSRQQPEFERKIHLLQNELRHMPIPEETGDRQAKKLKKLFKE